MKIRPIRVPFPPLSSFVSDQAGKCSVEDDLGSINVQAFDGVAEAFFGLVVLQIDDLVNIARRDRVAGEDLVFRRRRVRDVVGFQDRKSCGLAN